METCQKLRKLFQYGDWMETSKIWKHGRNYENFSNTGTANRQVQYGNMTEITALFQNGI